MKRLVVSETFKIRDCNGNLNELLAFFGHQLKHKSSFQKGFKTAGAVRSTDASDYELSWRAEVSELIEIDIVSPIDEDIVNNLQVHTVRKPCSNAKNVPCKCIDGYAHLKSIADRLHLSGGAVNLLVGTDFVDAFIDIHTLSGLSRRTCCKVEQLRLVYSGASRFRFKQHV